MTWITHFWASCILSFNYSWWFQPLSLSLASIQRVSALPAACNLTVQWGKAYETPKVGVVKLESNWIISPKKLGWKSKNISQNGSFSPQNRGEHWNIFQKNTPSSPLLNPAVGIRFRIPPLLSLQKRVWTRNLQSTWMFLWTFPAFSTQFLGIMPNFC